jgi:hypothetical protein
MAPSGLVAVLAGWITTEVGRQPWTIQGLLRTAESASPLAAPALRHISETHWRGWADQWISFAPSWLKAT